LHAAVVLALAFATVHQIVRQTLTDQALFSVLLAAIVAGGFTVAYRRSDSVALWTRFTAVLPIVAVGQFLFFSPTSDLLFPDRVTSLTGSSGSAPSVVFLMLDELPTKSLLDDQGHIDEVRFPNLARLADTSTWYRNHTAVATGTKESVPAMLTGKEPEEVPPIASSHPDSLFTLLGGTHDQIAFESLTQICATAACQEAQAARQPGVIQQLRRLTDGALPIWQERVRPGTWSESALDDFVETIAPVDDDWGLTARDLQMAPERFTEFLGTIQPPDRPTLWYFHLLLPHQPWNTYPDGTPYQVERVTRIGPAEEWLKVVAEQRHLFQAEYTDRLVGQLLDRLEAADLFDDSLVVLVADHGITFTSGTNQRRYSPAGATGLAFAPLIIKEPGQTTGVIDDSNILGWDVLPTLADILGRSVPWPTDGAPAGSEQVTARGDTKVMFDFGNLDAPEPKTKATFSLADNAPTAEGRWIRAIGPDEPPLVGLTDHVGATGWMGRRLDELLSSTGRGGGGEATVFELDTILAFGDDPPGGVVHGTIDEPTVTEGIVLVAIDDVVVTASPVVEHEDMTRYFRTLLPPGLLHEQPDSLRLALVSGGGATTTPEITELAVSP